jgi:hypothetical protein
MIEVILFSSFALKEGDALKNLFEALIIVNEIKKGKSPCCPYGRRGGFGKRVSGNGKTRKIRTRSGNRPPSSTLHAGSGMGGTCEGLS